MLTHVAVHGLFDLQLQASGDLEIDAHHTVEDCALALGQAFDQALGDREGIVRIGRAYVPMDEAWPSSPSTSPGGLMRLSRPSGMPRSSATSPPACSQHFFESLAVTARCNLHARVLYGQR